MNVDELTNKLQDTLNKLIIENDLRVKTTESLSKELLETIKIIKNCISCKDKKIDENDLDEIEKVAERHVNHEQDGRDQEHEQDHHLG